MKPEICISGRVLFPLKKGKTAVIDKAGTCVFTSPVVKIYKESKEYTHFETANSVYRVSMEPIENTAYAIRLAPMLMCA